jgi:DNA-directed RNA polymerase specialized sigma24 family protein
VGVEKRAFKQAMFAVRDQDAALDIVQDAMLRLAEKYGHLPAGGARRRRPGPAGNPAGRRRVRDG